MFDALARLADGNARRIGLFAILFFLLAARARRRRRQPPRPLRRRRPGDRDGRSRGNGCTTPGCGSRPCWRSSRTRPVAAPATRARVEALERSVRRRPDVKSVTGYYDTHSPVFVSHRRALHLLRRRAEDLRRQEVAGSGRRHRRRAVQAARGHRRRRRGRPGAGQQAGREGPADGGDARLPPALPALLPLLPQPRRLGAAADDRRPGDRRHLPHPAHRQRGRLDLDLRPQPDHGAGAGAGDRLQPLHRLPLPRGDRQGRAGAGGDAARARDRRAARSSSPR